MAHVSLSSLILFLLELTSLTLTEKKSYGSFCFTKAIIIHYMTKCKDGGNDHGFLYLGICLHTFLITLHSLKRITAMASMTGYSICCSNNMIKEVVKWGWCSRQQCYVVSQLLPVDSHLISFSNTHVMCVSYSTEVRMGNTLVQTRLY